ncbi:MAG: PAS domain-containing sensor histidine kinase [Pseudomonadota bacterium]
MPGSVAAIDFIRSGIPAHGSVGDDVYARIRHESFIFRNVLIGLGGLALIPVYLAVHASTNLYGVIGLGILSMLAPVAVYLSKSGNLQSAHIFQALLVAAFVSWLALLSGGALSPALLGFAILPFEAALTGSRRLVFANLAIGLLAYCGIVLAGPGVDIRLLDATEPVGPLFQALPAIALVLYGVFLVLEFERLNRESRKLAGDQDFLSRAIGENVMDAVSLHDQTGAVLYVTPSINDLLKVADGKGTTGDMFARVHVADSPAYLKALSDAIADARPTSVEFRARTGSTAPGPAGRSASTGGSDFVWLEMRCKPLQGTAGRSARIVAVTRDVTPWKHHAEELRRAREKAEEAYDLKTRFLANVSHELRTPLNAIIGFSDLLKSQVFGPIGNEKYTEYVQLIHDSGAHLLSVVTDILDMSKIEAGKFQVIPEPFDVVAVIRECIDMTMPQATEATVTVVREIDERISEINADRRAIRQILLNLLSNAIKFTEPGGTVTVAAQKVRGRIHLSVKDTGIGVSAADLKNLGKPFFQADNTYSRQNEGTGLGLSVVKGLTELHGGEVRVESEVGVGTTVTIDLPGETKAEPIPLVAGGWETEDRPMPEADSDEKLSA